MGLRGDREAIEARVGALIAGGGGTFEPLALELFVLQAAAIPAYGRFAAALGAERPMSWLEIPAVPQSAYKSEAWLGVFARGEAAGYFETSGTSTGRRGRRPYRGLELYETAACGGFREAFAEAAAGRVTFGFLKESPEEAPRSSLSRMFEFWRRAFGTDGTRWLVRGGAVDARGIAELAAAGGPVFLAGTAFAFLRWVEDGAPVRLPPGSSILETGGFKGLAREISRTEFHAQLASVLGVAPARIVNEYGMTELFSQAYAIGPRGLHVFPPWMRFRIRDPFDGTLAAPGRPGLIELVDLANCDVPLALQTEDLGIDRGGRLELLGRAAAEPRGCSLGAEQLGILAR